MDRFTRWPEAVPLRDTSTETVATALIQTWVSRFGVPAVITTDRGAQFTSSLWSQLSSMFGIRHIMTTSYHPSGNGFIERFHRVLKASLRASRTTTTWSDALPLVMLGIRSSIKEDLGVSSAELVYGQPLRLPGEYFPGDISPPAEFDPSLVTAFASGLSSTMQGLQAVPTRVPRTSRSFVAPALEQATHVFIRIDAVRRPLQPPYEGPFRVLKRTEKYYVVDIAGRHDSIAIDRPKPAFLDNPTADEMGTPNGHPDELCASWSDPISAPRRTRPGPDGAMDRPQRSRRWPPHLRDFVCA